MAQVVPLALPPRPPLERQRRDLHLAEYATRLSTHFAVPPPSAMKIVCSNRVFRALWIAIVLFQLVLSVALLRAVYSNIWTLLDHDEIVEALRNFGIEYDGAVMAGTALVTIASIIVNVADVVRYIMCSVRHRQLLFHEPKAKVSVTGPQVGQRHIEWLRSHVAFLGAPFLSLVHATGVHGAFFDIGLYAREALEIALQTYQTRRVTYYVSEPWINKFATSLVVINCWTTPLLDLYFMRNEPMRRALCLTADLLLDTLSGLALPMLVFASYRSKLAAMDWYDPLWIMDAGNDLIYFHINTWLDLLSRTMPSVSLIHCLHSITPMLTRKYMRGKRSRPSTTSSSAHSSIAMSMQSKRVVSKRISVVPQASKVASKTLVAVTAPRRRRANIVHIAMLLYGAFIFVVGVLAQHGPQLSPVLRGCQKTTRPWFIGTERFPCAVLELNCVTHPELDDGTGNAMNQLLDRADRSALAGLLITHCHGVHMPSQLAVFRNVVWLELYNATVLSWPPAAALTQNRHSRMSSVVLVRVNVTAIVTPTNVLLERLVTGTQVPRSLQRIVIAASDLSTMADVAHDRERSLQTLVLEACGLRKLPTIVPPVPTDRLSLARNPMADFTALATSFRPTMLYADATQIRDCQQVPPKTSVVIAADAPLCSASPPTACGTARVDCASQQTYRVPLTSIDARRQATRAGDGDPKAVVD